MTKPFETGDRVRLRLIPTAEYLVESSTICEDNDHSTHLFPPKCTSTWFYKLKGLNGASVAYWYHTQLEKVPGQAIATRKRREVA